MRVQLSLFTKGGGVGGGVPDKERLGLLVRKSLLIKPLKEANFCLCG